MKEIKNQLQNISKDELKACLALDKNDVQDYISKYSYNRILPNKYLPKAYMIVKHNNVPYEKYRYDILNYALDKNLELPEKLINVKNLREFFKLVNLLKSKNRENEILTNANLLLTLLESKQVLLKPQEVEQLSVYITDINSTTVTTKNGIYQAYILPEIIRQIQEHKTIKQNENYYTEEENVNQKLITLTERLKKITKPQYVRNVIPNKSITSTELLESVMNVLTKRGDDYLEVFVDNLHDFLPDYDNAHVDFAKHTGQDTEMNEFFNQALYYLQKSLPVVKEVELKK